MVLSSKAVDVMLQIMCENLWAQNSLSLSFNQWPPIICESSIYRHKCNQQNFEEIDMQTILKWYATQSLYYLVDWIG